MEHWKTILSHGYSDIGQVRSFFRISDEEVSALQQVQKRFPMYTNPYYLSLIDTADAEDPIRKMSLPNVFELKEGGVPDTSGEQDNTVLPGLQHKYKRTALILSTNQCAMYCRHCFRKRMVGLSEKEVCKRIEDIAEYIAAHKEINNVLISGGDAFMMSNDSIRRLLSELCNIPHIDLIRFGTRTPVVLPQRITTDPALLKILKAYSGLNLRTSSNSFSALLWAVSARTRNLSG